MKKSLLSLVAISALILGGCSNNTSQDNNTTKDTNTASSQNSKNQIKMVGSSTVYPFASAVAEELGAIGGVPTPVVESTGTGGGMKMFCAAKGSPDITNASRQMKAKEYEECQKNGITNITQAQIGYDGIVLAQDKSNAPMNLTRMQIFLAVADEVPSKDGKTLIKNPYKKWSDIDASLPNRPIMVYGPPKSSGTRDSFEEMVMQHFTEKELKDVYEAAGYKKYSRVRTDGVYVDSGENDNLIVQKLTKDKNAIGIFGYGFLEENANKIVGSIVDGSTPTPENIASGKYPISRSLFFYVKNDNRAATTAIDQYVELFMSEKMIGDRGNLKKLGLIPLEKSARKAMIKDVLDQKVLTSGELK
ncbi:MAG: substrate-binding domain-containing protein [Sulfurovaceae bacterium]|nr:substrate-binding domain-containing protein [Sulfurovaceae bacterium]